MFYFSLSDYINSLRDQMFDAKSELELILARGSGTFSWDSTTDEARSETRSMYICDRHASELGKNTIYVQ